MSTRAKMMGLAALPLAELLSVGGAALAQTAASPAGAPAGTRVVQQAVIHKAGDPCPEHAVKAAAQQAVKPCPQHAVNATDQPARQQARDRDRGGNCDRQAKAVKATAVTVAHSHHDGNCARHDGHGDR